MTFKKPLPPVKPDRLTLLEYAREGLRTKIGTHPEPLNYRSEIDEYECHLDWVERQIKKLEEPA